MGYPGAVVLVSWQVSAQIPLLIGESPDGHQEERGKEDQSPPGPQSHGNTEHQQEPSTIHGVTDGPAHRVRSKSRVALAPP